MSEEKKGVKEVLDVVDCGVALVNCGLLVAKDKKISLDDLPHVFAVIPKLVPAIEGVKEIPAELKDIDSAEAAEVVAHVASTLAVESEKAKVVIGASLKTVMAVKELVEAVVALKK